MIRHQPDSSRKSVYAWLVALALVAGGYAAFFTDLIFPPELAVYAENLDTLRTDETYAFPLMVFAMEDRVRLSSLRVVQLDDAGQAGPVVWRLNADPTAVELDTFTYGSTISGMSPPADAPPRQRLEPGRTYRLELRAGRRKGAVEFKT
ncbi:MAG: hypothetical protein AAF288_01825 [Planctomycetota bacterium]